MAAVGLVVASAVALSCQPRQPHERTGTAETSRETGPDPRYLPVPEQPRWSPGALNQLGSVVVAGEYVFAGTEAGIVRLHPATGQYLLLWGDEEVSHGTVTGLAVDGDGTVWSSHGTGADAEPPDGGARPDDAPLPGRRGPQRGGVPSG